MRRQTAGLRGASPTLQAPQYRPPVPVATRYPCSKLGTLPAWRPCRRDATRAATGGRCPGRTLARRIEAARVSAGGPVAAWLFVQLEATAGEFPRRLSPARTRGPAQRARGRESSTPTGKLTSGYRKLSRKGDTQEPDRMARTAWIHGVCRSRKSRVRLSVRLSIAQNGPDQRFFETYDVVYFQQVKVVPRARIELATP